ncbi:hypothetical protein LAZ67_9002782 [Cordylochernes scorpioides]|uniref:Uncharacterized protein n=1 Tax=Cordylochernes scorpioides TaxID=51811 RepID=A0ABY6KU36_9ARAC|nr:hypothetical protein LAZ67_9002782 [Cordylochernes scorpioides]
MLKLEKNEGEESDKKRAIRHNLRENLKKPFSIKRNALGHCCIIILAKFFFRCNSGHQKIVICYLHFRLLGIINQLKLPFSHQILWCNSEDVVIEQISIIKRLNCSSRSEANNACVIPAVANGITAHRIPSHFTIAHSMGIRQFQHFLELKLAILSLETFDDATIQWLQTGSHIWWKEVYLYVAETIIRDAVRRSVI